MKEHEVYTLEYFIDKFKAMPPDHLGLSKDSMDAWEWCGQEESQELHRIVKPFGILLSVNDGDEEYNDLGDNPKQRVVSFLEYIRELRLPVAI